MDEQHIPTSVHRLAQRWMPTLAAEQAVDNQDLWPAIQRRLAAPSHADARNLPPTPRIDPAIVPIAPDLSGERGAPAGRSRPGARRLMTALSALAAIGLLALTTLALAFALAGRTGGVHRSPGSAPSAPPSACQTTDAETLAACLFHSDFRWQRLDQQGLVQHPAVTSTMNGITVAVWRAYADANVLALVLTIAGQPGQSTLYPETFVLTDANGRQFTTLDATRIEPPSCTSVPCSAPLAADVMVLDTATLPAGTTQLDLHLTIGAMRLGGLTTPGSIATPGTPGRIEGLWALSLSLPVLPARVTEVGQEVSAGGITLHLDRVIATPAETRLRVRGVSTRSGPVPFLTLIPTGEHILATPAIRVVSPGQTAATTTYTDDAGLTTYRSPVAAYDHPGDWLAEFKLLPSPPGIATPTTADTWIFRFTVPDTTR